MTSWRNVSTGMTPQCEHGNHEECPGHRHFLNCPCSCHHGRTTLGECAMYGCDCHKQEERHGLPFSERHRISCLVHRGPWDEAPDA